MNIKKLAILFSLQLIIFTSCTLKEKLGANTSSNDEQIEPQPVLVSGKNAFNTKYGTILCSFLPKDVTEYTLFCHAYVQTSSSQSASNQGMTLRMLSSADTGSWELAKSFEDGVRIDWKDLLVTSSLNPVSDYTCRITDNALGYTCVIKFSQAIISLKELTIQVLAESKNTKTGENISHNPITDVRNQKNAALKELVERSGEKTENFVTFDFLSTKEKTYSLGTVIIYTPSPTPVASSSPTPTSTPTPIDLNTIESSCITDRSTIPYTVDCTLRSNGEDLVLSSANPELQILWNPISFNAHFDSDKDNYSCTTLVTGTTYHCDFTPDLSISNRLYVSATMSVVVSSSTVSARTIDKGVIFSLPRHYDSMKVSPVSETQLICQSTHNSGEYVWHTDCRLKIRVNEDLMTPTGFDGMEVYWEPYFVLLENPEMRTGDQFNCTENQDRLGMHCDLTFDPSRFGPGVSSISGQYVVRLIPQAVFGGTGTSSPHDVENLNDFTLNDSGGGIMNPPQDGEVDFTNNPRLVCGTYYIEDNHYGTECSLYTGNTLATSFYPAVRADNWGFILTSTPYANESYNCTPTMDNLGMHCDLYFNPERLNQNEPARGTFTVRLFPTVNVQQQGFMDLDYNGGNDFQLTPIPSPTAGPD